MCVRHTCMRRIAYPAFPSPPAHAEASRPILPEMTRIRPRGGLQERGQDVCCPSHRGQVRVRVCVCVCVRAVCKRPWWR